MFHSLSLFVVCKRYRKISINSLSPRRVHISGPGLAYDRDVIWIRRTHRQADLPTHRPRRTPIGKHSHAVACRMSGSRVLQRLRVDKQHLACGPKPKKIKDRILKTEHITPIQRPERYWSQRQKTRVLVFLYHHRIPVYVVGRSHDIHSWCYRAPTQQEASEIYQVPQRTISDWVRKQDAIESYSINSIRIPHSIMLCQWPELELKLYNL